MNTYFPHVKLANLAAGQALGALWNLTDVLLP